MPRSGGFLVDDDKTTDDRQTDALPLAFYRIFLFHKPTRPSCLRMQWFTSQLSVHVFDMGDHLLQRGTIYGTHRMSGGTIYDDTSVPGGPLVQGDQLTRYSTEPTVVQWSTILREDRDTHWDAEEDPELERSQHSSILVPGTPGSSESTELSSTQYSPQLL